MSNKYRLQASQQASFARGLPWWGEGFPETPHPLPAVRGVNMNPLGAMMDAKTVKSQTLSVLTRLNDRDTQRRANEDLEEIIDYLQEDTLSVFLVCAHSLSAPIVYSVHHLSLLTCVCRIVMCHGVW